MKITAINIVNSTDPAELEVSHKDQSVSFNVSYYGRSTFVGEFDLFEQLNAYWASLPEELQCKIYLSYAAIRNSLDAFMSDEARIEEINQWAKKLISYHDFDQLKNFLFFHTDISIPACFKEKFIYDVDRHNSPEQTYLRGEYVELVTLTLIFRSMMPIWGNYITLMRQEHGTRFKEYQAFRLISGSEIKSSHPYVKMQVYIDCIVSQNRFNQDAIIEGISSEDFLTWVLAKAIVRRLCMSDIRGKDPRANLVTFLHKYVSEMTRPSDVALPNQVKAKESVEKGNGENELSSLDRYRPKHGISIGELVENEFVLEDLHRIAYQLGGINMSNELIERCMATTYQLSSQKLMNPQMTLLRWVFKPAISPRGLMYVSRDKIIRCLGILQAVLWAKGHKYLAVLATSYANIQPDAILVSSMDSKARIPKELVEELDKVYPYQKMYGGKNTGYKTQNLAIKAIDQMTDDLSMSSWIPTADNDMLLEALGSASRRTPIEYNIKIILGQFVLELGKRM